MPWETVTSLSNFINFLSIQKLFVILQSNQKDFLWIIFDVLNRVLNQRLVN